MTIFSLSLIGVYVSRMIDNIEKYGLQKAIKKEIKKSGSKLEIYGLDYLRLIAGMGKILSTIKVYFSKPQK